ncbi:preprotein translocase subunit SecG [Clostridium vincentii]|uniref:Protein-export membrane protein SecG n=1 Tax=Clostridium vincentii TaxID=52704 RepID=A0A2T0BKZ9_9CLOT|nr:preprotein translocase subunit SecG [Clostridium vincentii]PRR84574.1 preprotein translocase subunit SecG [Clostridium vincentii]
MKNALLVIEVILGLSVIVSVLMQPSKSDALSGLVQGSSSSDSFYSKNKSKTKEVMLARVTVVSMLLFAGIAIGLNLIG